MAILLIGLLVFLLIGIPVAYAIGLSGFVYFLIEYPELLPVLPQRFYSGMNNYALISLPLFILMGNLMNKSGITERLISLSLSFVGRLRGGLGLVNVSSSMIFGGISGSAVSDTASIGSILIPEMKNRGYPVRFAAGITVASSTMGMIIPPSVPIVLFAIVTQESVGRLFLGGVIPGILIGFLQLSLVVFLAARYKFPREQRAFSAAFAWQQLRQAWLVIAMPLLVVGSVVFGIATATESAALGVLYSLLIGFLLIGGLKVKEVLECFYESILTSAKIMVIIALSTLYIWILALERVPQALAAWLTGMSIGPVSMLLLMEVIVLIAGTIIDVSPAILLLAPVFMPALAEVGVSPIVFGVLLISGLAIGACTPPVGTCLNVGASISGLSIGEIFRGAAPFLLANILVLILVIVFPQLVLWLPGALMPQ
jgi:tripartite ATP-independent transporter DctM subunit